MLVKPTVFVGDIGYSIFSPPWAPSAPIHFCLKTEIFFSGLAYCPHVFSETGHQKRIFSKNALQSEDFWKRRFSFTCGRTETKVFEYDDVIHHMPYASSLTHSQ